MDFKSVKMIDLGNRQTFKRALRAISFARGAVVARRLVTLRSLTALLLFCAPALSFALGLGPITMKSALNQPLKAEIDLHSVQKGDLDGLVVKMASSEDFKRISVEKTGFLSRIDFKVKKHADGSSYIELSTSRNVTEPYLDFLIEARWPRGRALKEYTVLVDPPVLTAEAPAPVRQAQTSPVFAQKSTPRRRATTTRRTANASKQRFRPINKPKPAPIPDPEPFQPRSQEREQVRQIAEFEPEIEDREPGSFNHGVIRRNETLSEIALDMKSADVTLQQMMLALLRSNPHAFIDGNINKMKAGASLRIDDASVLDELSRSEAYTEVSRQNRQWRGSRTVQQVASNFSDDDDFALDDNSVGSTSAAARLKLVAAGSSAGLGTGGSVEDSEGNQQVREELLLATEALDAQKQESTDLKGRLSELEEQLESMQRLINLKDQEMASLQTNLKNQQDIIPGTKPEVLPTEQQTLQQQDEFTDEEASFLSDQTIMALAIFMVVAVVAFMVIRRRKMQDGFEESILNIGGEEDEMMSSTGFGNSFGTQAQSVGSMASAFGMSDMNTGIETDTSEVDPISEADVYLAYGRHQQAEDILKQAIQTDDSRLDIHAKLMEVYNAAGNQESFESHAQFMFDRVGGDESNEHWQKIVQMGAVLCPSNPLFGGAAPQAEAAAIGGNESFDMSLDSTVTAATGADAVADDNELLDFEFDMGDELDTAASGADVDDNSLDFDISSLDFNMDDSSTGGDSALTTESLLDDDNALDFDMGTTNTDTAEADELNFDGLDLDIAGDDAAPIDLVDSDSSDDLGLDLEGFDSSSLDEALDITSLDDELDLGSIDEPIELTLDDDALDLEEVSDLDEGFDIADSSSEFDETSDLTGEFDEDIFANVDEIGSKLDLAKAYVDMGDSDGARSILDEVLEEGDDTQKEQAQNLLSQMA